MEPWCLRGRWRLERTLVDHIAAEYGHALGTLTIEPDGTGGRGPAAVIRFSESGELLWAGRSTDFSRTTLLRRTDEDDWWMYFTDGRPFHPWRPGQTVVHPCGPDRYAGQIDVVGPERMTTVWRVTGPAKDHTYRTSLRRIRTD